MSNNDVSPLGIFGKYLTIWVALCITSGVILGNFIPSLFELISRFEYAKFNFAVAILIWIMIYPMMIQVDLSSLKNLGS